MTKRLLATFLVLSSLVVCAPATSEAAKAT